MHSMSFLSAVVDNQYLRIYALQLVDDAEHVHSLIAQRVPARPIANASQFVIQLLKALLS